MQDGENYNQAHKLIYWHLQGRYLTHTQDGNKLYFWLDIEMNWLCLENSSTFGIRP